MFDAFESYMESQMVSDMSENETRMYNDYVNVLEGYADEQEFEDSWGITIDEYEKEYL